MDTHVCAGHEAVCEEAKTQPVVVIVIGHHKAVGIHTAVIVSCALQR